MDAKTNPKVSKTKKAVLLAHLSIIERTKKENRHVDESVLKFREQILNS